MTSRAAAGERAEGRTGGRRATGTSAGRSSRRPGCDGEDQPDHGVSGELQAAGVESERLGQAAVEEARAGAIEAAGGEGLANIGAVAVYPPVSTRRCMNSNTAAACPSGARSLGRLLPIVPARRSTRQSGLPGGGSHAVAHAAGDQGGRQRRCWSSRPSAASRNNSRSRRQTRAFKGRVGLGLELLGRPHRRGRGRHVQGCAGRGGRTRQANSRQAAEPRLGGRRAGDLAGFPV